MSENENTKKSTEYWKNVFKKCVTERKVNANLEEYECEALDRQTPSQFYAELQKENGVHGRCTPHHLRHQTLNE